jgi:hypothetical protein
MHPFITISGAIVNMKPTFGQSGNRIWNKFYGGTKIRPNIAKLKNGYPEGQRL